MHRYPATITAIRDLSPTAIELTLGRPDGSAFPYFRPGQYATICFPANKKLRAERSFSIASAPTKPTVLNFGIRIGGRYTQALRTLKPGDAAMVALPFGSFTFDPSTDKRVLLVAGGIGVTPFLSMIRSATDEHLPNKLTLLYSVRAIEDVPYRAELDALAKANPNFRYLITVTSGRIPDSPVFTSGYITPELIAGALQGTVSDQSFFLCGPPPFMAAMVKALKRNGVPEHLVRTERFSAGSPDIIERKTAIPWVTLTAWGAITAAVLAIIVKAEQLKRTSATIIPWTQTNTNTTTTPTVNTPVQTTPVPTNTTTRPPVTTTPTPTTPQPTPVVTRPTPVVTQPTPQPTYQQVPTQPQTRLS